MLPLRGFQLVSDLLNFGGGVSAQVDFATKTQNFSRAAVIGMDFVSADETAALFTFLDRFDIAGRPYKQGDSVPLGLFTPGAYPTTAGAQLGRLNRYFPGSRIPLANGTLCSGMMINGREDIRLAVTKRFAAVPSIQNIILHCVEFPVKAYPRAVQLRIDELWDRLRSGIGQFHFVGNRYDVAAAANLQVVLEALVNPPHTQNARRTLALGLQFKDVGGVVTLDEANFLQNTGQFFGTTNAPHSNAGVPARSVVGHHALHIADQIAADFERDTRSLNRWTVPVAAAAIDGYIATCFEGTDAQGVKLCGPAVF